MDMQQSYWRFYKMPKNYVNACLRWMMNELYPYYCNNSLPEHLRCKLDVFYDSIDRQFDWSNPTEEELHNLGFLNWAEDYTDSVWFIPNWLTPVIPEGLTVWNQNNEPFTYLRHAHSREVNFGCLTFGIKIV